MSWSATLEAFIWDRGPAVVNQHIFKVIPEEELVSPPFLYHLLRVVIRQLRESDHMRGVAMMHIKRKPFLETPVAIPPLAEQHRIVAKVDQLMALCDELEARQQKRNETRVALNNASLDSLLTAPDDKTFTRHWHLVRDQFHLLYGTPKTVPQLRKSILQLAVQGRLLPQDSREAVASLLIDKIRAERTKREAAGQIRRIRKAPDVGPEEKAYPVPRGWEWARFGEVTFNRDGERIPLSREVRAGRQGPYDYYGASGVIDHMDGYLFDAPLLLIGEDGANLLRRSTPIAFIAKGKYWVNNHAHVLDSVSLDCLRYLALHINAIDLAPYVTGTAQPKMNQAKMNSIPVAFPPECEQRRIVAKVDRLMALCDELEAKLQQSQAEAERLMDSVVHHLLAA